MLSCVVLSAMIFVWSHRFLPLQDLPEWLAQGRLFADLVRGQLTHPYSFKGVLVPNAISSVTIGLLSLGLPPEIAVKCVLSAYILGYVSSVLYLLGSSSQSIRSPLLAAGLLSLLNFSFFHGEINYALALPVLFNGQGLVLRTRNARGVSVALAVTALSLVIFVCHGLVYAAWLVFLAAYALASREPRTRLHFALATLPSLVLLEIYVSSRTAEPGALFTGASLNLGHKLWLLAKFLSPFQGFYPFMDARFVWLFITGNVLTLAIAAWAAIWWSRRRSGAVTLQQRAIRITLSIYAIGFVLAPQSIGGLLNPAERLVLPMIQLLLTGIVALQSDTSAIAGSTRERAAAASAWTALAMQTVFLHGYAGELASSQLVAAYDQLRTYAHASPITLLRESDFEFQGRPHPVRPLSWNLLPLHFPMVRLTYYASLEASQPVPLLETGLFRSAIGPSLNNATAAARLSMTQPVVIVGWHPANEAIANLLMDRAKIVASDEASFIVMQAR